MLLIHHVTWSYFRWPRCLPEPPTFEKSKRIPFIRRRDGRLKLEGIHFVLFFGKLLFCLFLFFLFWCLGIRFGTVVGSNGFADVDGGSEYSGGDREDQLPGYG